MKRKINAVDTSVNKYDLKKINSLSSKIDGNQLKKIKTLTCQLANDEKDDDKMESSDNVVRNMTQTKTVKSDNESDISDCESELSLQDDDCEIMKEEDLETLKKFLNPEIAKDVVGGMKDAKEEVALNMDLDEMDDFNIEDVEGAKEHFEALRELLARFKKGRVFPKTVKVMPQVDNWPYLMELLDFQSWSTTAIKLMTEQFLAKGGEPVETYFKNFLMPVCRENISKKGKLDNVLYQALQASLFRRREFMTNLLLPWCADSMNGKEADILSHVLKNSSVKVDVAAPAMTVIINQMPFSRETLVILNAFLEKKYNLPYQTISAFVDYFYKAVTEDYSVFYTDNGKMPLLWFKTLLLFVSLYHPNLNEDGTKKLFHLCRVHCHDKITDAIRSYLKMVPKIDNMDLN